MEMCFGVSLKPPERAQFRDCLLLFVADSEWLKFAPVSLGQ